MTETTIWALGGVGVLLIGALTKGALDIIKALRETKVAVQAAVVAVQSTTALSVKADKKLDTISAQGDGMRTELLDRVAALELMLSSVSGNTIRANNAQQAATDHRAATDAAKEKTQ